MLDNLNQNLDRWEGILREEHVETLSQRGPEENPIETETVGGAPESNASSSIQTNERNKRLGIECPTVGRRHSLPLTVPSLLPRTVIRRESLTSEEGHPPIVFETLQMGESIVDSVVTVGTEGEEAFMQPPSIATMGEVGKPRRVLPHSRAQRRQSLPPLWDKVSLLSRPPLQPMPPTPLQEELPPIEVDKDEEKKPLLRNGAGSSSSGDKNGGMERKKDPAGEGSKSSHKQGLEEFRPNLGQRNCVPRPEEVDKENVAPPRDRAEKTTPNGVLKTRLWRSLNQEEEIENSVGRGSKPLLKHLPQVIPFLK